MNRLQQARQRRRLTNAEIAKKLKMTKSYVAKLINGERRPKWKTDAYDRVARFLLNGAK